MNSRPEITINNKPSQAQLKDWYENGVALFFTESNGSIHNGRIIRYQPTGDDALLWIEDSRFGVYLRNITNYTLTSDENKCIAFTNKEFLLAVRERDYAKCTDMLSKGAHINEKFGKYSQSDHSACGPNDTPLTYAVNKEDEMLVEFLLKNGADTEVFNCGENPLMNAAFNHNEKIVKLLLDAGANPNTKNQLYSIVHKNTDLTAMHNIFLGLKDWLLDSQKEASIKIVDMLIKAGFAGEHNEIANTLSERGYKQPIHSLFTEIWQAHYNKELENFYTQGAAAGALDTLLPPETTLHIGLFLDRRSGGRLAQTCAKAKETALGERSKKAGTLFENDEIRRLVKKYTLPDICQDSLEEGLRSAANNNKITDLKIFIKYVKNINAKDSNPEVGRTALHLAAIKRNEECCRLLMAAKANPDILDAAGESASKYLNKFTSVYKPIK